MMIVTMTAALPAAVVAVTDIKKEPVNSRFFFLLYMQTKKTDITTAWFGALCFFLSTVEYMIPKPLPFLRLGLANIPVMLALDFFSFPSFCVLILIKIIGQGLIGGTLFSYIFLFSAAGTISSALVMLLLKKLFPSTLSYIGLSIAGAFASSSAQLLLARFYIFGTSAWFIAPPFLAAGAISGTLLGIFTNQFALNSKWYADVRSGNINLSECMAFTRIEKPLQKNDTFSFPAFRFVAGIFLLILLMFSSSIWIQTGIVALAILLMLLDSLKIKILPVLTMSVSIIAFNLCAPFGKILYAPFNLPITEGALLLGIKKALTVEGMIFISRWMIKPGFRLPGKIGLLISQAFTILNHLTSSKKKLDRKKLIHSIDLIMYGRD